MGKPRVKSAKGVKGFLLRSAGRGFFFRVYDEHDKSKYQDYTIVHSDVEVTIGDGACLWEYDYDNGDTKFLDYPLEVLGEEDEVIYKDDV